MSRVAGERRSTDRRLEGLGLGLGAALAVVALLYLFRFGSRSPAEFYVLTALLVGGGAAFATLRAKRQQVTGPALVLDALGRAGLALVLTVGSWFVGLLFFSEG